ncbi:MAG: D-arabinono-1,4-lactone oxidase [Candidatus Limnocylindria bacterium]
MLQTWCNWSRSVRCAPARIERPASEAELAALLRGAAAAGLGVRVAGRGHSHTPLVATGGLLLELDALAGLESSDPPSREATLRAGTRLSQIGAPLLELGLAMENLGDVDVQALAGAIATGTHGTGSRLRSLSNQVAGLRLFTAEGERLELSEASDPRILSAARVALGALGVVSAVRLRLLPAYQLHERIWREDVEPALEALPERVAGNRHFEFFWLPHKDRLELKTLNPTLLERGPVPERRRERVGPAHEILPSLRDVPIVEMEYAVPAEHGVACFLALRERMRTRHPDVSWPIEYRTLAADEIPLSPAQGRETVTLSLHQGADLPWREFFADCEPIFWNARGRPHWGKIHSLGGKALRELYPRWDEFHAVRRELDPRGRFLNAHLRELFGDAV